MPRDSGMNYLGKVLSDTLKRMDLEEAALEARTLMLWPRVVGEALAAATEPTRLQGRTLVVTTRSSAWSQELAFQKPLVLRRLNEQLGRDYVRDLRFAVGRVRGQAPPPVESVSHAEEVRRIRLTDDEIRRIREAAETADPEFSQVIRRALTREAQARAWNLQHGAHACSRCGAAHRSARALCPACVRDDATPG